MNQAPVVVPAQLVALTWDRRPARARQLRWVVGELALYAATLPPGRDRPRRPDQWLDPAFICGYLAAADAGALRRRAARREPSPDATRAVRRTCLRLLAAAAGVPDPVTDTVAAPTGRASLPDPTAATLALARLSAMCAATAAAPAAVRAAAIASLAAHAGLRTGELAALQVGDVDTTAGTLTYTPAPPARAGTLTARTLTLPPATVALVAQWLSVRADLVALTPRVRALWVSLGANHDGSGRVRPPGLPLRPGGLRRAHAAAIASCNSALAGTPGYGPLGGTPGFLRPPG